MYIEQRKHTWMVRGTQSGKLCESVRSILMIIFFFIKIRQLNLMHTFNGSVLSNWNGKLNCKWSYASSYCFVVALMHRGTLLNWRWWFFSMTISSICSEKGRKQRNGKLSKRHQAPALCFSLIFFHSFARSFLGSSWLFVRATDFFICVYVYDIVFLKLRYIFCASQVHVENEHDSDAMMNDFVFLTECSLNFHNIFS